MVIATQTKEVVRIVTAKYEVVAEKSKTGFAKAESLYKVLQAKYEQMGQETMSRGGLSPSPIYRRRFVDHAKNWRQKWPRRPPVLPSSNAVSLRFLWMNGTSAELSTGGEYGCQFFVNRVRTRSPLIHLRYCFF